MKSPPERAFDVLSSAGVISPFALTLDVSKVPASAVVFLLVVGLRRGWSSAMIPSSWISSLTGDPPMGVAAWGLNHLLDSSWLGLSWLELA
jgi:hypothetical protein